MCVVCFIFLFKVILLLDLPENWKNSTKNSHIALTYHSILLIARAITTTEPNLRWSLALSGHVTLIFSKSSSLVFPWLSHPWHFWRLYIGHSIFQMCLNERLSSVSSRLYLMYAFLAGMHSSDIDMSHCGRCELW